MGAISWWHWLIIGGFFVLLFGGKKLPEAARGLGRSLRILKSEVAAMNDEAVATSVESMTTSIRTAPTCAVERPS